eukprot:2953695-Heterocapsa_arctica.AAC.2
MVVAVVVSVVRVGPAPCGGGGSDGRRPSSDRSLRFLLLLVAEVGPHVAGDSSRLAAVVKARLVACFFPRTCGLRGPRPSFR